MKLSFFTVLAVLYLTAVWAAPQSTSDPDETDIDDPEDVLSSGHHPSGHQEHLIEYEDERGPKGYTFHYKTDKGTERHETGKLVKNQPYCYCSSHSCGGHNCGSCHCRGDHCTGGDHCKPDHCTPGASVSEGGFRCRAGVVTSQRDDSVPAPEAPVADQTEEDVAEEEGALASGGGCGGGHCSHGGKVIISEGDWEFRTPDCIHVKVTFKAGFEGFVPHVVTKRIPGCIPKPPPHHHKDCTRPDSKFDRHGNKCTCKNPHHVYDYKGKKCPGHPGAAGPVEPETTPAPTPAPLPVRRG